MKTLLQLDQARVQLPGPGFGPFQLRLQAGERTAILGPSGAGKSTLLRLLAGELPAREGRVYWLDRPLAHWPAATLARMRAVLPQSHAVAFSMPVELVVALGRLAREPDPQQPAIVTQALQAAQAAHLAGRRFDTLSGGEQARVQLARVLAQLWDCENGLLLVDEPLAALDPGLQFELLHTLDCCTRERGHALVAVLHDINQALAHFDRLWLLREGRLLADVPADQRALPLLEDLYGIQLRCWPLDDAQRPPAEDGWRGRGRLAVLAQRRTRAEALT
jgi:iron complex transport system ATP-binding protein